MIESKLQFYLHINDPLSLPLGRIRQKIRDIDLILLEQREGDLTPEARAAMGIQKMINKAKNGR